MTVKVEPRRIATAPRGAGHGRRTRWIALALAAVIVAVILIVVATTGGTTAAPRIDARTAALQHLHQDAAFAPAADAQTAALQRLHADAARP